MFLTINSLPDYFSEIFLCIVNTNTKDPFSMFLHSNMLEKQPFIERLYFFLQLYTQKLKFPPERTAIRLVKILKTEQADRLSK